VTVILAIDALEYDLVERFDCAHLHQRYYGKTDIREFSEPRTMVLWTSFMTGMNMERQVLALGDKEMWNLSLDIGKTLFKKFDNPSIIDLPGFSYDLEQHAQERNLLKQYFDTSNSGEKERIRNAYNHLAFEHHRKIKAAFRKALEEDHDFVLGYFSVADVIGHLNFDNTILMRMVYRDLDEIAATVKKDMIVLSDHGMVKLGIFGDHSDYGFWSTRDRDLGTPKITDFYNILLGKRESRPYRQE
jgi:hypothetical protein